MRERVLHALKRENKQTFVKIICLKKEDGRYTFKEVTND